MVNHDWFVRNYDNIEDKFKCITCIDYVCDPLKMFLRYSQCVYNELYNAVNGRFRDSIISCTGTLTFILKTFLCDYISQNR